MGDKTVLVVDDDPMVLSGLTMLLESWGFAVLAAEDLDGSMDSLGRGRPDLMVADLRLKGGASGLEVVERVRGHLHAEVPAIILTGAEASWRDQRPDLTVLIKPVQPAQLRRLLADLT
ncbi:MAG: response regulator [Magnetospirillum sp.]|nr:response regulator [Magnetospirillum sp.]